MKDLSNYGRIILMIKIYNTLSKKKELLSIKKEKPGLFVCGITAYDSPHLGHAKTYLFFDFFTKYLKSKGYNLFYLQNITDIDDKIIKKAKEKNISPIKLAREYEKEYLEEMKLLKVNSVSKYARATENIKEIISQVERLIEKGFAYQIKDGIYFDIKKFKNYGKLSRRTILQAEDGVSRIDEGKGKNNRGDFCLWKFSKEGEPKWKSPFGEGRPGWHIEDTAIAEKYLGSQYEIHAGGRDLIFPHHEAEIAQMEAISGKRPYVKYWMHTGFLTVEGQKMSKSLNNFITLKELLTKYNPRILRYFLLKHHYRSPFDYDEKKIEQAKKELEKIDNYILKCKEYSFKKDDLNKKAIDKIKEKFEKALENDFNTPIAVSLIFDLLKISPSKEALLFIKEIDKYFNVFISKKEIIPEKVKKLVKEREKERKANNFEKADIIREKIENLGYKVEDTKKGPAIKKI